MLVFQSLTFAECFSFKCFANCFPFLKVKKNKQFLSTHNGLNKVNTDSLFMYTSQLLAHTSLSLCHKSRTDMYQYQKHYCYSVPQYPTRTWVAEAKIDMALTYIQYVSGTYPGTQPYHPKLCPFVTTICCCLNHL